jgi:hypothetical protein
MTDMKNHELFAEDPRGTSIPNLGVAKVDDTREAAASETLRYELRNFVCDGAYEQGLDRLLSSYLRNIGSEQPAGWVSGFYGSGKSHLVKVLEQLWRNETFPDGANARGLVRTTQQIDDQLRELDVRARRSGAGVFAAAGNLLTLPKDINEAFLHIVLRGAGLPVDIAAARCVLWMESEGIHDSVKEWVLDEGHDWDIVLDNMYVSELAEGILAVKGGWAASPDTARTLLATQFAPSTKMLASDVVALTEQILRRLPTSNGAIPCTLVVLDELQQYIGEDPIRAADVQGLVEACSSHFGGLLLVVATGQSDLAATPTLQKLIDRFAVKQQLSDADVDKVIREVVLRKRPDRIAELQHVLEKNAGEIDRQIAGSRIAPVPADGPELVTDYPLLPSRRRFWEAALHSIDSGGRAGQLRTQLRVVHEAVKHVAEAEVGTVVSADFLFEQQAAGLLTSGVLLREVNQLIEGERANQPDGDLRARVLALVFLISKLSREGFADTGVRATTAHISDLLVDDLDSAGEKLRKDVPRMLKELADESKLSLIGDEYKLQSKTGQEWTQDFQQRRKAFVADVGRASSERAKALRAEFKKSVPPRHLQGVTKTPREVTMEYGDLQPSSGDQLTLWVRDGWEVGEKAFADAASATPTTSALLFAYIPRVNAEELDSAISERIAAEETISTRAVPQTDEGRDALKSIRSISARAGEKIREAIDSIMSQVVVRQAGGSIVEGAALTQVLSTAFDKSLDRLFPKFSVADSTGWAAAGARAIAGNQDWLQPVSFSGAADQEPVSKEVLAAVGPAGAYGATVREKLTGPPFGWPLDALNASLIGLVFQGFLTAQFNGTAVTASSIKPNSIGKTSFRRESTMVDVTTRAKARGVLQELTIAFTVNEEAAACAQVAAKLDELSTRTGGAAPLPVPRTSDLVNGIRAKTGNELVQAIADLNEDLRELIKEWTQVAALKEARLQSLDLATRLVRQLDHDPQGLQGQIDSVRSARTVLNIPDPISPIVAAVSAQLRGAIQLAVTRFNEELKAKTSALDTDAAWTSLDAQDRSVLLQKHGIAAVEAPKLGSAAEVLRSIESRSLAAWQDMTAAIDAKLSASRAEAARLVEPKAQKISLPAATLTCVDEVEAYVAGVRDALLTAVEEFHLVVV